MAAREDMPFFYLAVSGGQKNCGTGAPARLGTHQGSSKDDSLMPKT